MRKIAVYGIIFFQVLLIGSLLKGIQESKKSQIRVDELTKNRDKLAKEKKELEDKERVVNSEYYLEKVAREDLHLVKPGETVVVMPQRSLELEESSGKQIVEEKEIWQMWWELLVK